MAKTYEIHYSEKEYFRSGSTSATMYKQGEPIEEYWAGGSASDRYGVLCRFSGLSSINSSRVTGITLYMQRLVGGSYITYTVQLYGSVLSESVDSTLRAGYPVFTTNREICDWAGNDTDTGGEYRSYTIDSGLFSQLRDYGWAITYRGQNRRVNVGDVYLVITTSETDYTLSYNANGGSGAPASQTGTGVGSYTFTISNTRPTRTGYSFLGWSLSSAATTASYQPGGTIKLTSNDTLYAVWKINTYAVTFNSNGGGGAPASQTKTYGIALTLSSTIPTRTGHTFVEWNTGVDGNGVGYSPGDSYTANASMTLYAQWTANTYVITYDANGGSGAPAQQTWTYASTGSISLSSQSPSLTGYVFLGWSTSTTATTAEYQPGGSFSCSNVGNRTLYATWTPAKYTIVYDGNGATSGTTANSIHTYNVSKELNANGFTKTNYIFSGWKDSSGNTYTDKQSVLNLTSTDGAVITLYAQWELLGFQVDIGNYDTDVFANVSGAGVYSEGVSCSVLATLRSDTGYDYVFEKWDSSDDVLLPDSLNNPYDFNMPGGDVTLTPIGTRTPYPYTVVYDGNGATGGSMPPSSFLYGTPQQLRANSFERPTYEFKGWATSASGAVVYEDGALVSNLTSTKNGTVTLYACWELETYSVTYNANGGTGVPTSQTKQYGVDITLSSIVPTKTGYTFNGWATEQNGNVVYQPGGTYTENKNIVLYAVWEVNTYSVVYLANGGAGSPASQTKVWGVDLVITSVRPTRMNYNFLGWGLSETGSVEYEPGDTYSQESNLVLYAIWQYDQMNFLSNYNSYINSLRYGGIMAIRLQWLNPDGSVAFDITDDMISQGTLNVSYSFGSRRSATVTMDNWANLYDVHVDKIWFGQQVKLWLGMYDEYGVPHLVPNGVFYINDPSITDNPGQKVSNLNLVDKWHWLNGTLGGKLEAVYSIALGANLFDGIKGLLTTDRGNGYPIDNILPLFDRTISSDKIPCPYEYRSSDSGSLSDVLTAIGTMLEASMGYDEVGRFCVENIQLDVDTSHRPVQWEFLEDEVVLVGMSTRALMSQLYNDIIVCGGVLGGSMAYGRATDTNPASPSCVQRIGYKTNRHIESKYYSNEQCQGLAEYYLNESIRVQSEKTFQCSPIYHLKPNNLVSVVPTKGDDKQYYLVNSFTIPFTPTGQMTIQATSVSDMRL